MICKNVNDRTSNKDTRAGEHPSSEGTKITNTVTPQRVSPPINSLKWKPNELKIPQSCYNLRSSSGNNFKNMVADVLLTHYIFNANHIFNPAGKNIFIDALINEEDGDKNRILLSVMRREG